MMLTDDELLGRATTPIPPAAPGAPYDLILLDRDGTLNVRRPGYVDDPDRLDLLPGAVHAVRAFNAAGCRVVLVTNQRGISTGALTPAQLVVVHRALLVALADGGAHLDAIQVCPHQAGVCDCRKPQPGLIEQAFRRAPWADRDRCVLLGDQPTDVAAAQAARVRSALIIGPQGLRRSQQNLLASR